MRKSKKLKKINLAIVLVVAVALLASIVALSINFYKGANPGESDFTQTPGDWVDKGQSGTPAIGEVDPGYNNTDGTAISNTNKEQLYNMDGTNGNFYLTEDIDDFVAFSMNNGETRRYSGTFDGNGHTIRATSVNSSVANSGEQTERYKGGFLAAIANGAVIKNVTFVLDAGSVSVIRFGGSTAASNGVGVFLGLIENTCTVENVRVVVESSCNFAVTLPGNSYELATGVLAGVAGANLTGCTATIKRVATEMKGTWNVRGQWLWASSMIGLKGDNDFTQNYDVKFIDCMVAGNGAYQVYGLNGGNTSGRFGYVMGAIRKGGSVNVNGFIFDFSGTSTIMSGGGGSAACSQIMNNDNGGSAAVTSNLFLTTRHSTPGWGLGHAGGSMSVHKINVAITAPSGATPVVKPSFDSAGNIMYQVTGLPSNYYYDAQGTVAGARKEIVNGNAPSTAIGGKVCAKTDVTGEVNFIVMTPEEIGRTTVGNLITAINSSRTIKLTGSFDFDRGFTATGDYKATFLGNGQTITFNGATGGGASTELQGGLFRLLNGARVKDLNITVSASFTRDGVGTNERAMGFLSGGAINNTVIENVHVKMTNSSMVNFNTPNVNSAFGGILGMAAKGVTMSEVSFDIAEGSKIEILSASKIGYFGGLVGANTNASYAADNDGANHNLTITNGLFSGGGRIVLHGSTTNYIAGIVGINQNYGIINANNFVLGFNGTEGHNGNLVMARTTNMVNPRVSGSLVAKLYYVEDNILTTDYTGSNISVSNKVPVKTLIGYPNGTAPTSFKVNLGYEFSSGNIVLSSSNVTGLDEEYLWTIEIRQTAAGRTEASVPVFNTVSDYRVTIGSSGSYSGLGLYLVQGKSLGLPTDLVQYEHGYVPNSYLANSGYLDNADWTPISKTLNSSGLANLSGDGKYYLTEDIEIVGFAGTSIFNGVLDGCGYRITIATDGGSAGSAYTDLNGSGYAVGGLFSQLGGTVKNLKLDVKASASRSRTGDELLSMGGLAGKLNSGATIENVSVKVQGTLTAGTAKQANVGAVAGVVADNTADTAVVLNNVTVTLSGTLAITAEAGWSWTGGFFGATSNTFLNMNQVILKGMGTLNNLCANTGTYSGKRAGGLIGGARAKSGAANKVNINGYIYDFEGNYDLGGDTQAGNVFVGDGDTTIALENYFRTSSATDKGYRTGTNRIFTEPTNVTVIESSFSQRDQSVGYVVPLYNPALQVGADNVLVVSAVFEDQATLELYLVARIEVTTDLEMYTSMDTVKMVNSFFFVPGARHGKINLHIKGGSATDGIAGINGANMSGLQTGVYTNGWLTDNGRVPAGYGVPFGATAISSEAELLAWLNGTGTGMEGIAYNYGYLTADVSMFNHPNSNLTLASGRVLDGVGFQISFETESRIGSVVTLSSAGRADWMHEAATVINASADVFGSLVAVNNGTIRNLSVIASRQNKQRVFGQSSKTLVFGEICGVNKGLIENCSVSALGTSGISGNTSNTTAAIYGMHAGVNQGTIKAVTSVVEGTVGVVAGKPRQIVVGGIAAVNDGGLIEYVTLKGNGIFQAVGTSSSGTAMYSTMMGGVMGYGVMATAKREAAINIASASVLINAKQGKMRYVVTSFEGRFYRSEIGTSGAQAVIGQIAGFISHENMGSISNENKALGIFSTVNQITGWGRALNEFVLTGDFSKTVFFGSSTWNPDYFSGGYIDVKANDAKMKVGEQTYHTYWDYWGGSGTLVVEYNKAAGINPGSSSAGSYFSLDVESLTFRAQTSGMVSNSDGAPKVCTNNAGMQKSYADYLYEFSHRGDTTSTGGGTDIADVGLYTSGNTRLTGSGNFYLSRDLAVDVSNKTQGSEDNVDQFSGTFDGRGHTITINGSLTHGNGAVSSSRTYGLIANSVNSAGRIKNLKIIYNAKIHLSPPSTGQIIRCGIIAGIVRGSTDENNVQIENVHIEFGSGSKLENDGWVTKGSSAVRLGVIGEMNSATIKDISVDYGKFGANKPLLYADAAGTAITASGFIGVISGGHNHFTGTMYMTGQVEFRSIHHGLSTKLGLLAAHNDGSHLTVRDMVLDNVDCILHAGNGPTDSYWLGRFSDGSLGSAGSVNFVNINSFIGIPNGTKNKPGASSTGAYSPRTDIAMIGTSKSFSEIINSVKNDDAVTSQVTNGVGTVETSPASSRLYSSSMIFAKNNSIAEAEHKVLARNMEMGYFLWQVRTNTVINSPEDMTLSATAKYKDKLDIAPSSQKFTSIGIGQRGLLNFVEKQADNTLKASGNSIVTTYNGSNKTDYAFRPVYYGTGGSNNLNATHMLGWNVGGEITSGRIPSENALTVSLQEDPAHAGYYYYNAASYSFIRAGSVMHNGTVTVKVNRNTLNVSSESETTGIWKDSDVLTIGMNSPANNNAIDQITYSADNGVTWRAVAVNYQNGVATAKITDQSAKGGSTLLVRGYSGISVVTENTTVRVFIDTEAPAVSWTPDSTPLNDQTASRVLLVDDVSIASVSLGQIIKITGPTGHGLFVNTSGGISHGSDYTRITVQDNGAKRSGEYTFTITDRVNHTTTFTEYIDFTPPTLTASVTVVEKGGITAINRKDVSVALTLKDNYVSVQTLLDKLTAKIVDSSGTVHLELNTANGGIIVSNFDMVTGAGTVTLNIPDFYHADMLRLLFEVKDGAQNRTTVEALQSVFIDTRAYTLYIKNPETDSRPFDAMKFVVDGASAVAASGSGDIMHILNNVRLFSEISITLEGRKLGFVFGGLDIFADSATTNKLGNVAEGSSYIIGLLAQDEHINGGVSRYVTIVAAQQLELETNVAPKEVKPLKNGNWSDTLADYDNGIGPNFASPETVVNLYNETSGNFDKESTVINKDNLANFFNISLLDPDNNAINADSSGRLTFKLSDDPTRFVEGTYTLRFELKPDFVHKYTVTKGISVSITVSERGRRNVNITYGDTTSFEYNGERDIFFEADSVDLLNKLNITFDLNSFDEGEDPNAEAEQANLTALIQGINRLSYTLYYGGTQIGSRVWQGSPEAGQVVTSGVMKMGGIGNYMLTISVPISGENRFNGVTGAVSLNFNVTRKLVIVEPKAQQIIYGNLIDGNAYTLNGLVAKDVTTGADLSAVNPGQVKPNVIRSMPKLSTEYTTVRVINGVVMPYDRAISSSGALADNYEFQYRQSQLIINKRTIILKISDLHKTYGNNDPSLLNWELSQTGIGTNLNMGYGNRDNFVSFKASNFNRTLGEDSFGWSSSTWTQMRYEISGMLNNENYSVTVENGSFYIDRRELMFDISGDQGLIYEEGIIHKVTAKISNGLTKDRLTVSVIIADGDWMNIGEHSYMLSVLQNGAPSPSHDGYFANYNYSTAKRKVRIGASILNVVMLPQVITYGQELNQEYGVAYMLEGLKGTDSADDVMVTVRVDKENAVKGYHVGKIYADVSFRTDTGKVIDYTVAVRRGNLTVLPKVVDVSWLGSFVNTYTGKPQTGNISAQISTPNIVDQIRAGIRFEGNTGSGVTKAGAYRVNAVLEGDNSENYVVNPQSASRQFVIEKSEQRISVIRSIDGSVGVPQYDARDRFTISGVTVYKARISILELLGVTIASDQGYSRVENRVPTISVYSLNTISGANVINSVQSFGGSTSNTIFYLEPGLYDMTATLPSDGQYYPTVFEFTISVRNIQPLINTNWNDNLKIATRSINGAYKVDTLNATTAINDPARIGYVIGPSRTLDNNLGGAGEGLSGPIVKTGGESGRVARLTGMNNVVASEFNSHRTTLNGQNFYGTHDGDWAYTFFNVSVSEEIRQKILQGKVAIRFEYFEKNYAFGKYNWHIGDNTAKGWRESYVDSCNLGYAIREIGSGDDLQHDPGEPTWMGTNANAFDFNGELKKFGSEQGFKLLTNGIKNTLAGKPMQYGSAGSQANDSNTVAETVPISRESVKSGNAFRFYLTSQTLHATRFDTQISGGNANGKDWMSNKRNIFDFKDIKVTFVETGTADKSAPTVTAQQVKDSVTGMTKYQYIVRDDSGVDINFSNVSIGGINYRVGNGLSVISTRKKFSDGSPVYSEVTYETNISESPIIGDFEARDLLGNKYKAAPALEVDKSPPAFASAAEVTAEGVTTTINETFWYNKKQQLSIGLSDPSGIETFRMYYIKGGSENAVPVSLTAGKIVTNDPIGTGTYFVVATDSAGNMSSKIINLLVDETRAEDVSIVIDPKVTPGSWQDGDVIIQNTVTKFGDSFGRMYYATSETDFRDTYQTDSTLQWLAMDISYIDGVFTMSESIKTAQMRYYAFKYVGGAESYPGANDPIEKFAYLGYIKIDREKPSISVDSYRVTDDLVVIDSLSSGQWTNNNVEFIISGSTGLGLGQIEYSLNGYSEKDDLWMRPGYAGYAIEYCDNLKEVLNTSPGQVPPEKHYTQFLTDDCFVPNTANTAFSYEARLVIRGHNNGSRYAFRFVSGSGAIAISSIGAEGDGFRVNIDTRAPEVTNINSSWQQGESSSQIFIREPDSGIKNVTVFRQQLGTDGNGIFVDGKPVFETNGELATLSNGKWYYRFTGVWYLVKVEDNAGNVGQKEVKLKIDEKQPNVTLNISYSKQYLAPNANINMGTGVWAANNAEGIAYVDFEFTVSGGTSGYSFWYSNKGYTGVVSEWTMPSDANFHKAELPDTETTYINKFVFRVSAGSVKDYTFRFISGAQLAVYYDFQQSKSVLYDPNTAENLIYQVNIDSIAPDLDEFQYKVNGQWLPSYDDSKWQTSAVSVRFTATEQEGLNATGLGAVTVVNGKGEAVSVTLKDGYYEFLMTDKTAYIVTAFDRAGNKKEIKIDEKKIDTVAPTIEVNSGTYGEGGWTKEDVTLSYTLHYGASGISGVLLTANKQSTAYSEQELAAGIVFSSDINESVTLKLTMVSGITVTHNFVVRIDKTKAIITVDGLPSEYTTNPQSVTVAVADGLGSGVKTATLSAPAGFATVDLVAAGGSYTMIVSDWREYTVTVLDNAGNETVESFAANIDASKPEGFRTEATSNGASYTPGVWTTKDIEFTFYVKFFEIEGNISYGNIEYRTNEGIWKVLFRCSAENRVAGTDAYRYVMSGETEAIYEFRAITLAGNVSEDITQFGEIKQNTVPSQIEAVGTVGDQAFAPSDKGYTWVPGDIKVVFNYTIGISTGRLYYEYKQNASDPYEVRYLDGLGEALLTAADEDGKYAFTVRENGFYRFVMVSLAAPSDKLVIDYGEIKRDVYRPDMSIEAHNASASGDVLDRYISGTWTANSVALIITLTFGESYVDSILQFTTSSGSGSYALCDGYDQAVLNASQTADGKWKVVYKMVLDQNQINNYSFRARSGAGVIYAQEYQRPGGAVRIDKNKPNLIVKTVVHKGDQTYADLRDGEWVSDIGWTKEDIRFTFAVRTYASGGTLKYKYGNMPGFISDNISTIGGSVSGSDEFGAYVERTYQLTLSGSSLAINSSIQFRVESGAGKWSNEVDDKTAIVPIKVDKRAPALDENSIQKTPSYPSGSFINQSVVISFKVYDPEVGQIKSDIKEVRAGYFTDSDNGTVVTADGDGRYKVTLENSRDYYIQIIDNAGNVTMYKLKENIDKEAPMLVVNTQYAGGLLTTAPIAFDFTGSTEGVSGAVIQYRKSGGAWVNIGGIADVFNFAASAAENLVFKGTFEIRALSGAGVASADTYRVEVNQDLNDYNLSVVQKVVAAGSYAALITYTKLGETSQNIPTLKREQEVVIRITERAEYPFKSIKVNGQLVTATTEPNGVYSFKVVATDANIDQNNAIKVELVFAEIIEVGFDEAMLKQSIRVQDGINRVVKEPFTVSQGRQGFEYRVSYKMVKDAYGADTNGSDILAQVPQKLGTYKMIFEVTTGQDSYSFATSAQGMLLKVYYFDLVTDNNDNTYYSVESPYDLAYIRYYQTGNEFRQLKHITLTSTILEQKDWNPGSLTNSVYNGANFKILYPKAVIGEASLFGAEILQNSEVKNLGIVYQDTIIRLTANGSYAPFTKKVSGELSNVYVNGTLNVIGGTVGGTVKIGGFALEIALTGEVDTAYFGSKIVAVDLFSQANIAGIANNNAGIIRNSFAVGSIIAVANASINLFSNEGTGALGQNFAVKGTLTAGANPVNEVFAEGVQYVMYWDLNNASLPYARTAVLNERFRPNGTVVYVQDLVNAALNGLEFKTDEQGNYYISVTTAQQLKNVDNYPWADFRQEANIDCTGQQIAIADTSVFSGTYDGGGYTIQNIRATVSGQEGYGLFGTVIGTIKNVVIKEMTVTLPNIGGQQATVGALVRNLVGGTVSNVSVGGTIVAGIGGKLTVGGVVGRAENATITNVLSTVSVTTVVKTQLLNAGSVVGAMKNSVVTNVYSIAKVDANFTKRASVGQLIGEIEAGGTSSVKNGYAVEGVTYVNGFSRDTEIGYDGAGADKANFGFVAFEDMMNPLSNSSFIVNGKHISVTLKTLFPFEGSGTAVDPFLITNAEEFKLIGNYLYANYVVTKDINFNGNFETIGKGMKFTGTIIGRNTASENVRSINGVTDALFDQNYGTIRSLGINVMVNKNVTGNVVFGVVANYNYGKIELVSVTGMVNININGVGTATVGGIVGINYKTTNAQGVTIYPGIVSESNADVMTRLGAIEVKYGGVIGVLNGGVSNKNVVQSIVDIVAVRGMAGLLVGDLQDPQGIVRKTTGGVYADITNVIVRVNYQSLQKTDLNNKTIFQ